MAWLNGFELSSRGMPHPKQIQHPDKATSRANRAAYPPNEVRSALTEVGWRYFFNIFIDVHAPELFEPLVLHRIAVSVFLVYFPLEFVLVPLRRKMKKTGLPTLTSLHLVSLSHF